MIKEFAVLILYTQLHVATPAGAKVALQWTDNEVAQGFVWDNEVVAFGVPDHDGKCLVHVDTNAASATVADDALWAVAVPFTAVEPFVSVGTVADEERMIPIAPGRYQLVFQARPPEGDYAYRLQVTFTPSATPRFEILKQGELGSDQVLQRRGKRI